jgi:hypothetical protein
VSAAYSGDIAEHPASSLLFTAWKATGLAERQEILHGIRVPGPIPLRSRYRHLLDPQAPSGPWDNEWALRLWNAVLRLEAEGDDAVYRNDAARARTAFDALLGMEPSRSHRVVTAHARIGFGDIALACDNAEAAISEYEAALALAREDHYRFGQLRALVGLAYVTLMFHTAAASLDLFTEAATLAAAVGDPGYVGNATLGTAECQERPGHMPCRTSPGSRGPVPTGRLPRRSSHPRWPPIVSLMTCSA